MPVGATPLDNDSMAELLGDKPKMRDALMGKFMSAQEKARELARMRVEDIRAEYKIEIMFGKERSISNLKTSVGVITIWESGRRLHGGGDQKIYWCGYDNCRAPILETNFAYYHVVCPKCLRENFLDEDSKAQHVNRAKHENKDTAGLYKMPVIVGERFFRLPPPKIADSLEKLWFQLECKADIYLKYHPTDIRYDPKVPDAESINHLEKTRSSRGSPTIYPLKNIIKDVSNGASVRNRFLALITA